MRWVDSSKIIPKVVNASLNMLTGVVTCSPLRCEPPFIHRRHQRGRGRCHSKTNQVCIGSSEKPLKIANWSTTNIGEWTRVGQKPTVVVGHFPSVASTGFFLPLSSRRCLLISRFTDCSILSAFFRSSSLVPLHSFAQLEEKSLSHLKVLHEIGQYPRVCHPTL